MKKFLAIFTLLAYFMVSTGFVVSMHYCMDELDSAQLGPSQDEECGKCGMEKNGGCCRDEVNIVKLQATHMASMAVQAGFTVPPAILVETEFLVTPFRNYTTTAGSAAPSPPLIGGQEVYIQNCVFRI